MFGAPLQNLLKLLDYFVSNPCEGNIPLLTDYLVSTKKNKTVIY